MKNVRLENQLNWKSLFQSYVTGSLLLLLTVTALPTKSVAQVVQDFEIELEPMTIVDAPGVHSYAVGVDTQGRWLVMGGRIDGLHRRQPWAAFWESDNNKFAIVIDLDSEEVWSASLSSLPTSLYEQLQSTNQEFIQRGNQLYIVGGYGYSATANDHITYPYLTAVEVDGLTEAIINGDPINAFFRQITNENMAVTGGYLGYLDSVFYLAGGQYFEGRYNPMGPNHGPGFIQEYTDAIRQFKIEDDGTNLAIIEFSEVTDTDNLHRRDYNMAAQVFPNGEQGFTMFSGVFQHDVDLPFLNSVDITASGYTLNDDFNQYLSQYHSAHFPIYDETNNAMHTIFFGGMSQFYFNDFGALVEDENVPFVTTISRVSRFADGTMEEVDMGIEMPALIGSGAEFIPHPDAPYLNDEILKLNDLSEQSTLIGYIYGGIESTAENIFFINDGTQSFASNVIFKVYLQKVTTSTKELKVDGNIFQIKVYPNPSDGRIVIDYFNPHAERLSLKLLDVNGKPVFDFFEGTVVAGHQKTFFELPELTEGIYFISIESKTARNVKTIFVE